MRRASWGLVLVFLVLQLILLSCRRGSEVTSAPPPTADASSGTSEAASPATTSTADAPGVGSGSNQKPPKPVFEGDPTPVPAEAQPTPDPELDSWTVLFYMSATEDLDAAALNALNEMAAARSSEQVNVVIQLDRNRADDGAEDWRGARRYRIVDNGADGAGNLQLLQELGPTNMGDPDSLTEFIVWAQREFPANHHALVVWGASRGWRGLALDPSHADDLSTSDLDGALERALLQSQGAHMDVVVLDGSMTAHLEVLSALAPHASYAVASPGILPPAQLSYGALLEALTAGEDVAPAELAQMALAAGVGSAAPGSALQATLAAFHLRVLPEAQAALEQLAAYLTENAELAAPTVARARHAAEITSLGAGRSDPYAAVDLRLFVEALARFAPLPELAWRAEAAATALEAMSVAAGAESDQAASGGVTVAFLPLGDPDNALYEELDLIDWQAAVRAHYEAQAEMARLPQGQIAIQGGESAGAQSPVLLGLELRSRGIERLELAALRLEEERRRLLSLKPLQPPGPLPELGAGWRAGVHQLEMTWDTTAPYLSDGANGDFVPLRPVPRQPELLMLPVQYTPAADGEPVREAVLLFDGVTQALDSVWQAGDADGAPRLLVPVAGDSFRLFSAYLGPDDELTYEPGVTLVYSDGVEITYDYFPLPSGEYQLGLVADRSVANSFVGSLQVAVDNEALQPGYRAYLNSQYGFQFLYPLTWHEPVFDGRRVATAARQRGPALTVSVYSQFDGASAAQLKAQVVETFGEIDILYEEVVTVGGQEGLLTAYGYTAEDGPHTGIFVAFLDSDGDVGYVVDVDGLALDEDSTIEATGEIVASWRFVPVRAGTWPEQWITTSRGSLAVTLPAAYGHATLENGWERFKQEESFLAVRADAISGEGQHRVAQYWAGVAARGVEAYAADDPGPFALGEAVWSRIEFSYESDDGPVAGLILATVYGGQEIVAWVETPAESFRQRVEDHFLVAIAGMLPEARGSAGLLYEATFEEPDSWGVGRQDGAVGAVREGVYELSVDAARGLFWTAAGASLSDGVYEVDVTQTSGSLDSGFGLLIRADAVAQSFYAFEISADGYAWIGWCQRNCEEATTLVGDGWLPSEAIDRGLDATNRLRIEARGSQLVFYVNDSEVGSIKDDHAAMGDVGLFAETFGEGGLRVQFDDLRVYTP